MRFYTVILLSLLFQTSIRGDTVLVTLYAMDLEATSLSLGLVVASTALFPMFFASYAGRLSDRTGYRMPIAIGMLGTGAALLIPFLFHGSLIALIAAQLLFGLFQIFTIVSIQNLVGAYSTEDSRSKSFAAYTLAISVANLIGPLLTGFAIDHLDYSMTFLILAAFSVIPAVFFLKLTMPVLAEKKSGTSTEQKGGFTELLMKPTLRKTFITSGIILTGVGIYEFYFPIYGKTLGLSASVIGIIIGCNATAFIVSRLFMPFLTAKMKEERVLGICLTISAVAFFLIPLNGNPFYLMAVSFLMGLGLGLCQPLSMTMAYNHSPIGRTGEVLGIRLTVNKTVQFLVPIVFGSVGSLLGFFPIFWSNAVLLGFSGVTLFEQKLNKQSA